MGGIAWDGSDRGDRVKASQRRSSGHSVALYIGRGQQTVVKGCCGLAAAASAGVKAAAAAAATALASTAAAAERRAVAAAAAATKPRSLHDPKRRCCQVLLKATGSRCAAAGAEDVRGAAAKRS
ncbi:LOW QUALITY PROTEIN: hypothetical protein, conserved [Eimeria necatrix]|uniref:Uncharacterized protein n=1 Tax=Eimeria necatrix TaxID=51315 RepID=U6MMK4_9EIME|nr:LOW QUALITY PROTEIN: hypothetical protein, conserved [Eimeria necatrix]CDJ64303.1 hypothetical protein, conserved [Eimeria necatrix]